MLSFEEFKAQRQKEREEASKKASVPATASKSTVSSSQYQEALNQSGTLTFEQFRARQQGGFAAQAGQAFGVQTPVAKWQTDRSDLIKELNEIDTYSGWITYEQQANETEKRRAEILAQLETGDIAAGIAPESYSEAERGRQIFRGATGQSASGYLNFAGTGLDLLKESALSLGGDISPYAGYATDEVSAAQIGRQPAQRQDFSDTQVYVDKLQSAADRLGESANAELQKAKSGLGKFGQIGVDIAANVLQMGYDAAIGRIPGVSSLGSMFIRSAGSGAQQARQQDANVFQQAAYGTVVGGVEVLTEKMFDGVAKIYGAGAADEAVEEAIRKLTKSDFGKTALRWFAGAAGEGIEEVVSDLVAPYAETIYNGKNIGDVAKGTFTGDTYDLSEILYDFVIGAAIGGLGGATSVVTGQDAQANRELLERDAGMGDVTSQANDAWEVLTGRRTAEQQAERERAARERLGITAADASDMAAYRAAARGENILERESEPTEEQKSQNRKEVMRGILDRTAAVVGEELTDEEADALAAAYNAEDGTKGSVYAKAAVEAYQLGKSGKYTLEEAMQAGERTAQISAEQFRTAFNLGAGVQATEAVAADVSTQEGKAEVRAAVASLGEYAEEAASVYEEGQDLSSFAAGMSEAAERFAVTGEDVRAQEGGIPAESVISRLSDAQIVKAQEIGAKLREQRAAARQKVAEDLKAARELAAEMRAGEKADMAEIERRISEANQRGAEAQKLFKSQLDALEAAVKADPSYEETEDYARAYDEAKQSMETVKEAQRAIRDLEKQKQSLEGKQTKTRKKGTVSYNGGNIAGTTYEGVDRESMTRQQKHIAAMVERLADIVNIDYVLFSGPSNMGGAYVQGGVIYININAGTGKGLSKSIAAATLGHELTHFMQEYAPEDYQALKDYVVKAVLKKSPAEFDRLVRQQRRWEPGKKYDELADELVANACQTMLLNDKAVTQMARENMSLAEKVADVLDDLRAKIAAAFDSVQEENRAVFAAVKSVADEIDGIAERWGKGIAEAVENYNAMQTVQQAADTAKQEQSAQLQRFDDTTDDTAEERNGRELAYARLQSENAILRETVDELRKLSTKHGKTIEALQKKLSITKTPETRQSDARKLAKALVQEHGSKADVDALAKELKALGDYILQTETDKLNEDEIKNRARSIAREIVESASEQISVDDGTYSEIADDIKGSKLSIDEAFLGELDQEGGYDRFRKSLFGRLTIAKRESNSRESREGYTSVEQFYVDMQNQYGKAYFPDVANEGKQVQILAQMLDAGQPMEVNPYEQYIGEASEEIANRIVMDAMSGVLRAQEPTTMDKQRARTKEMQDRIQQLKAEQNLDQREAANLYRTIYDLSMALDKAESKYKTLRKKASYRAEQVRAEGRARAAEVKAAERERAAEKIDEWKNKYKAEKQAHKETREKAKETEHDLRQHWRDVKNRERERRSNTAMRLKIAKLVDEINGMLKHPTEKKHVPAHMLRAVVDILEMLDFNTGRGGENMRSKLANLRVMYDGLKNGDAYRDYYTPEVAEMLENVAQKLGVSYGEAEADADDEAVGFRTARNVYDMTNEQLNDVYRLLRVMVHTINTANKVRIGNEERNAFDLMLGATMDTRGVTKNHAGVFSQHVIPAHLRADVAFEWFAGFKKNSTWGQLARMLNDGQLKQTRLKMELSLPFAELFNNEKSLADFTAVNAFGKIDKSKLVDVGLTDEDGNAILIPHDFMVATYLDLLREEGRRHFIRGGLTVPNFEDFYAGKGGYGIGSVRFRGISAELADLNHERSQEMRRLKEELAEAKKATDANAAERVQKIREDMKALRENGEVEALLDAGEKIAQKVQKNIEAKLTDYDRAWIKATQKLMDEDSKRELNATTMEVYGIEKANSPHYFPIFTDKDFINKPMETIVQDTSLENVGFMKETVKAGNPILAVGTVWAVTRQIDRVAQYCGMMPAIRNFGKVYDKTQSGYNDSMKKALHEVFDNAGTQYVENLIADLSGSKQAKREDMGLSALLGWLRGNLARSELTGNPRVALAQSASLPTAAAELGYKPIAKALANAPKDGSGLSTETLDLIGKWSPLMWYRMQGYSSPELGNITGSTKWEDRFFRKMRFITGWIQGIDGLTVGRLWYASEYWVQEHKPDLKKGSNAYYEAVAAKWNDVVEKTQPNYTTMQRAAFLRNPGDIAKTFGMFMTQRLQNFNILFSAVGRYQKYRADFTNKRNDVTQADVREARDNVARAVSSQLAQAAMFTCIKVVVDFLLHNTKKYRDKETGDLTFKSVSLAIVDAYLDALMGTVIFGSEVYGIIKAVAGLGKWYGLSLAGIDTINDICESIVDLRNANVDWDDEKSRKSFYKRVMKVATSGAQALGFSLNNALKIGQAVYYWIEDAATGKFLEAGYERTKAQNTEKLLRALEIGDEAAIQAAEEALGGEKDAISAVKKRLKDQFLDGDITEEAVFAILAKLGVDENDSYFAVIAWATGDGKYTALKRAAIGGDKEAFRTALQNLSDHGVKEKDATSAVKTFVRKAYFGDDLGEEEAEIMGEKTLSAEDARKLLAWYCGMSVDDAIKLVAEWDETKAFIEAHGSEYENAGLTIAQAKYYYGTAQSSGISLEKYAGQVESYGLDTVKSYYGEGTTSWRQTGLTIEQYSTYRNGYAKCKGTDKDGDGKTDRGSVKAQVVELIDSLPVSSAVKDAIYLKNGWSKAALNETPWH